MVGKGSNFGVSAECGVRERVRERRKSAVGSPSPESKGRCAAPPRPSPKREGGVT